MKQKFLDLPNWDFDLEEVSAGVYEVVAIDALGHRVSAKGGDLDALVEQCRCEAFQINDSSLQ